MCPLFSTMLLQADESLADSKFKRLRKSLNREFAPPSSLLPTILVLDEPSVFHGPGSMAAVIPRSYAKPNLALRVYTGRFAVTYLHALPLEVSLLVG